MFLSNISILKKQKDKHNFMNNELSTVVGYTKTSRKRRRSRKQEEEKEVQQKEKGGKREMEK